MQDQPNLLTVSRQTFWRQLRRGRTTIETSAKRLAIPEALDRLANPPSERLLWYGCEVLCYCHSSASKSSESIIAKQPHGIRTQTEIDLNRGQHPYSSNTRVANSLIPSQLLIEHSDRQVFPSQCFGRVAPLVVDVKMYGGEIGRSLEKDGIVHDLEHPDGA